MKKIFLMLAATGLMFSSCQKDENLGGANSGEALVTVTATVPQAVGTRAAAAYTDSALGGVKNIADADYDLRFILKIYEGETVVKEDQWTDEIATLTHQKQYRLVPGHNYTFVVWADIVAEDTDTDLYYKTTAFPEITEVAGKHAINEEARDAYFVTKTIAVEENANVDLTLKRPFGKVRVVTTDWAEDAVQNGGAPTEVTITYNDVDVYGGINIKSGDLLASTKATNAYTADINNYSTDATGEKTLYVDYIWGLPATDGATAATVEQYPIHFTIATAIRTYEVKADVPVTRNWLTTVKGNILTTNTNININVDPNFGNNHDKLAWDGETITEPAKDTTTGAYLITNEAEFAWLGGKTITGTVEILTDLNMRGTEFPIIGVPSTGLTFNGNNHTISDIKIVKGASNLYGESNSTNSWSLFYVYLGELNVSNLTLDNASVNAPNGYAAIVVAYNQGKTTLTNVDVTNSNVSGKKSVGTIIGHGEAIGTITMTGCDVKNTTIAASETRAAGLIGRVCSDTSISNSTVTGCSITAPSETSLLIGQHLSGDCTIDEKIYYPVTTVSELKSAIGTADRYVAVTTDMTSAGVLNIQKNVTIASVKADTAAVITGALYFAGNISASVEGINFKWDGTNTYPIHIADVNAPQAIFKNCTFDKNGKAWENWKGFIHVTNLGKGLVVDGCTFVGNKNVTCWAIWGGITGTETVKCQIMNSTFTEGGICFEQGTNTFQNVEILNNTISANRGLRFVGANGYKNFKVEGNTINKLDLYNWKTSTYTDNFVYRNNSKSVPTTWAGKFITE